MSNSKENSLVKNTLLFSIGNTGSKLLMLVIVPFYTYFVTVEQMGQYDLVNAYVNLFAPIACLTLYEGLYRWLLNSKESKGEIIWNAYVISCLFVLVFDVSAAIFLSFIKYDYLLEFIIYTDSIVVYSMMQFTTRGLRNNKIYALQGIIYTIVLILTNVIFVFVWKLQARGLIYSAIIANIITSFIIFFMQHIVWQQLRKARFNKILVLDLIKYSLPLVPNTIAWWLVSGSNRVIINKFLGDIANGLFSIALKFPTIVSMLTTFFYQAWQEQAITEFTSEERDAHYTKIFNIYVKLLLSGGIALLPISKVIIIYFMDSSYSDASNYLWILYLASIFNALGAFYGTGYLSAKKTIGAFYTTIIGAMLNILINFVFIDILGLYAASIGNLIGNLVILIIRIVTMKSYFYIKINWKNIIILLLLYFSISIVAKMTKGLLLFILEICSFGIFIFLNWEIINKLISMANGRKQKN